MLLGQSLKRARSKSWDPTALPPNRRSLGPRLNTQSRHSRAQTTTSAGAGLAQPRRGREDFRKALVNLIM